MDYKHIRNITELFIETFSYPNYKHEEEPLLLTPQCLHTPEELSKKEFCLNIGSDLDCIAYRLLWIAPDGTLLFTPGKSWNKHKLLDHRESVIYVLKKYYQTLNNKDKVELLKYFFGTIYKNQKLKKFFESHYTYKEIVPDEMYGNFDSDDYEYRVTNYLIKEDEYEKYKPRFNNFIQRFINSTGIVRLRLKTKIKVYPSELDKTDKEREQTGFNIETWKKLTLNQQQFLRDFIETNKLIEKNAVFIDDNTPYKTVKFSLGAIEEERFHSFGHAYRVLTKIK